jgi:hypothetical protein
MNPPEHARVALARRRRGVGRVAHSLAAPIYVFAVLSAAACPIRASAEEPTKSTVAAEKTLPAPLTSPEEINRWIKELGHDAFTVRQAAASQLLAAGMAAREPLLALVDGPDPETRAAARRLVALIDQSEFHRRLAAFAADIDGEKGLTLPGWDQYQKLVGSDPAARALFVDMQRQEGVLLAAAFDADNRAPGELLQSRLKRLLQWQNSASDRTASPPLGSCAAMLFLGSVAKIGVSDDSAMQIEALLQRQPISETLRTDNRQDAVRRLVAGWVLHCPAKNEQILLQRLETISNFGLGEALPLALAVVSRDPPYKSVNAFTRAVATLVVGQLGGPEHVDRLEPLLADASICFPPQAQLLGQRGASVQVRDVALVVMLQLTGQRPADYGYIHAQPRTSKTFQIQTLFRENDQQRADAIAKWRQWRDAQKNATAAAKAD